MNQAEMSSTILTSVGLIAPNDPRIGSHFIRPLASSSPRATVRLNPNPPSSSVETAPKSPKIQSPTKDSAGDNDVEFIGQLVGSPKKAPTVSASRTVNGQPRSSISSPQTTTAAQAALAQQTANAGRPNIRMKSRPKKNIACSGLVPEPTVPGATTTSSCSSVQTEGRVGAETSQPANNVVPDSPQTACDSKKLEAVVVEAATPSDSAPNAATPRKMQHQQPAQLKQQPKPAVVTPSLSNTNNNNNNSISSTSNGRTSELTASTASTNNNPNNNSSISSTPRTPTQTTSHASNNMLPKPFDWAKYLELHPAPVAPNEAFMQHHEALENKFELKMKLIAKDPRNSSSWCLAWVVNVLGLRVRLRFDGSDSMNDFFELIDSENIRPYSQSPDQLLYPPVAYKGNLSTYPKFVEKQLLKPDVRLAPPDIFVKPPKRPDRNMFQCGMKLEAIDRKNAFLICPATVGEVQGDDIKIIFDGWRGSFDYTCKYYSREIFPVNWCSRTYHPIAPPNNWDALLLGTGDSSSSKKTSPNKTTSARTSPTFTKDSKTTPQSNQKALNQLSQHKQTQHQQSQSNSKPSIKQQQHNSQHQLLDLDDLPEFSCQRAVAYCDWLKTKQLHSQVPDEDDSFTVSESTSFASTFASNIGPPQHQETAINNTPSHTELSSSATSTQSSPDREMRPTRGRPSKKMKLEQHFKHQQQPIHQSQAPASASATTTHKEPFTNSHRMKPDSGISLGSGGFVVSVADVVDLIESDDSLAKYSKIFQQHEIDGKAFCLLTTDIMINHLGLKIGPVLKINSLIEQVKCHHRRTASTINQSM